MFFDITNFLFPILFRYHQINMTDTADNGGTVLKRDQGFLTFDFIKFIRRNSDNQSIPQGPSSFEQSQMTDVKQVECSVCQYRFHTVISTCIYLPKFRRIIRQDFPLFPLTRDAFSG